MVPFINYLKSFVYLVPYKCLGSNLLFGFLTKKLPNYVSTKWHTVVATSSFILPEKKLHSYNPNKILDYWCYFFFSSGVMKQTMVWQLLMTYNMFLQNKNKNEKWPLGQRECGRLRGRVIKCKGMSYTISQVLRPLRFVSGSSWW